MNTRVSATEVKQQINEKGFDYHHWGKIRAHIKFR